MSNISFLNNKICDETYKDEYMQQVVMDNELPPFCKNHHCTERGPKRDKCAYTAFSYVERKRLEA